MAPFESSNSNGSLSSLPNDTPKEVEVDTGFDGDSKLELFDCTSHLPKFVKIHYEDTNRIVCAEKLVDDGGLLSFSKIKEIAQSMIKTEFVSLHLYAKGNEQECKTIFTNDDELAYLLMERGKSSRTFNIFVEKLMILPEFIRLIYAKNALGYGFVEEGSVCRLIRRRQLFSKSKCAYSELLREAKTFGVAPEKSPPAVPTTAPTHRSSVKKSSHFAKSVDTKPNLIYFLREGDSMKYLITSKEDLTTYLEVCQSKEATIYIERA